MLCVVYIIAFIFGLYCGRQDYELVEFFSPQIDLPELRMSNLDDVCRSILSHNLVVAVYYFVFGLLSMGLLPIALSFYNGFILGNTVGYCTHILTLNEIISATLPHSAEFLGLNLCGAIGFNIVYDLTFHHKFPNLKNVLAVITIAMINVILSAVLECYVSIKYNY